MFRLTIPILCTLAAFALAACASPDSPEATAIEPAADFDPWRSSDPIPVADITVDGAIEIDDLDGTGSNSRDANLCAEDAAISEVCPSPGSGADNPAFPGPDADDPDFLGDDYMDWADLDPGAPHFLNDLVGPDDIFKQKSCLDTGSNPNKADIHQIGIAANGDYLYLLTERETTNGQEEWHYFFTQAPTHMVQVDSCANETIAWQMTEGDVRVTVRFQSTAGLPAGEVFVDVWDDPDDDPSNDTMTLAQTVVQSANWQPPDPATFPPPLSPAYAAFNVAPGTHSEPDEDTELNLDGVPYLSGQAAELAIDIRRVFGVGCGLSRVFTVITTASGAGGRKDDLKDFFGPIVVQTGTLSAELTATPTCDESLDYAVAVSEGEDLLALPHEALDIEIVYDCGDGPLTVEDDDGASDRDNDGPGGPLPVDVDASTACTVTARIIGRDDNVYRGCDTETVQVPTVHPRLEAQPVVDQLTCGDNWTWDSIVSGGAPPYAYDWQFTGEATPTSSDQPSGTGALTSTGPKAQPISGALMVSDNQGCEAAAGDDTLAYRALQASLTADPLAGECYDGGIPFTAVISGGSANYTLGWTEGGDATLDPSCADGVKLPSDTYMESMDCSFDLGDAACATGEVALQVTDPECGLVLAGPVAAERTTTTTLQ